MGKRCACEQLLRQLEDDARLRTLPMAAQMLWLRLMRLAASTPGFNGVLRFGSEFGFLVSVSLAVTCAETEAGTNLAILERHDLVVRGEDGVSLVLPDVQRSSARAEAARINGLKGGAPRKGEGKEAARERRQGHLTLPIAGGRAETQETKTEPSGESSRAAAKLIATEEEAAAAGETPAWVSLGQDLAVIAGLDPARGGWNLAPVKGWVDAGVPADLIRETVRTVAARPRPKPIGSLMFFHKAVMEAHERTAPRHGLPAAAALDAYDIEVLRPWQANGCQGVPQRRSEWSAQRTAIGKAS